MGNSGVLGLKVRLGLPWPGPMVKARDGHTAVVQACTVGTGVILG